MVTLSVPVEARQTGQRKPHPFRMIHSLSPERVRGFAPQSRDRVRGVTTGDRGRIWSRTLPRGSLPVSLRRSEGTQSEAGSGLGVMTVTGRPSTVTVPRPALMHSTSSPVAASV